MYLTHDWDPDVPIAETLGAFDELVRAGKVGAVGAEQRRRRAAAEALAAGGCRRVEWVQNSYSLLDREAEREVLPLCAEHGLGFTPFSPLAGGWLTGKYRRGEPAPAGSRMTMRPEPYSHLLDDDAVYDGLDGLAAMAAERGRRWQPSRSRGCSPSRASRRRRRPAPSRPARAGARALGSASARPSGTR